MWLFYRPRGSNFGIGAGLGQLGFLGFLILVGFLPFFVIFLAIAFIIRFVITPAIYLMVIVAALLYRRHHGRPPTWRLHPVPDMLDFWLDRNNIVKIPHKGVTKDDMDRIPKFGR